MNATVDAVKKETRVMQHKQQAIRKSGNAKNEGWVKEELMDVGEMEAVYRELLDREEMEQFAKSDGVMEVTQIEQPDDSTEVELVISKPANIKHIGQDNRLVVPVRMAKCDTM